MNPDASSRQPRLIQQGFLPGGRELRQRAITADLVIVGGGMAGSCAAVAAARAGLRVALVQDRPVLGGNASSEVRLWILGATSHMGNNNRWSREGGVIGEFLEENVYRNPEGNPLMVDALLLEMVHRERNIQLFLNTSVFEVAKSGDDTIESCTGFCPQNSTLYRFRAAHFMDASGDGVVAFLAGAAFRMGAESRDEWGEQMAPDESYGSLLGHSLYFYSKDSGRPVEFHAPSFAGSETAEIAKHRPVELGRFGCRLWWVEYGGRRDTVHETEEIKWELWKVVYGIWDYIKNSGKFPEAQTHTLEWVGMIPGKRESRRFEGLHMLKQQDIVERRAFEDVIAHGGWALDLHPADGVYSSRPGCDQWHSKGVYGIPLRCFIPRDFRNLVLAGRIISASHVAFGSTRVMATSACGAQAAALAVAAAQRGQTAVRDVLEPDRMRALQQDLMLAGQYLPGVRLAHPDDLAAKASWALSSEWEVGSIPPGGSWIELTESLALLLPVRRGKLPELRMRVRSAAPAEIEWQVRVSRRAAEFTPEETLAATRLPLRGGEEEIRWQPEVCIQEDRYIFLTLRRRPGVHVLASDAHFSGLTTVHNGINKAVGNHGRQSPPADLGVEPFEFWCPRRRPHPQLPRLECSHPVYTMGLGELRNGCTRPAATPGCWVADPADPDPCLTLRWPGAVRVARVVLMFDTDFDNAMESVLQGHADRVAPMCVRAFRLVDEQGRELAACDDNRRSLVCLEWEQPRHLRELHLHLGHPGPDAPASLFHLSVH